MADIEIVGIGSSVYDTLIRVPRYPEEDTKMESSETRIQAGGPCATALAAARKLGRSAAYVGTLGSDDYGRSLSSPESAFIPRFYSATPAAAGLAYGTGVRFLKQTRRNWMSRFSRRPGCCIWTGI